jgi:hypothetical protein
MTDDLQSKLGLNLLLTGGSKHQESRKPNSSGKMIKGLPASLLLKPNYLYPLIIPEMIKQF